jgi:hypothetical protein
MHIVKLKIEDSIYQNIMFVLRNLKIKGFQVEEVTENSTICSQKSKLKELFENNNVEIFAAINDPMQWQKDQREEWK